jgi:DNA polymerase-3 subunit epsilon
MQAAFTDEAQHGFEQVEVQMEKKVVLDTETTGLESNKGHRIIEIACVLLDERDEDSGHFYYQRINPERAIDQGATNIHGYTSDDLKDEPTFLDIHAEFLEFVRDATLIIHNAAFDIGFLEAELARLPGSPSKTWGEVIDTLVLSKKLKEKGLTDVSRHNLDALCDAFKIDRSSRNLEKGEFHGALIDARLLAKIYQKLDHHDQEQYGLLYDQCDDGQQHPSIVRTLPLNREPGIVIRATEEELNAHEEVLQLIEKESKGKCLWLHQ